MSSIIPVTKVTSTYVSPSKKPEKNKFITATLIGKSFFDGNIASRVTTAKTNLLGEWELDLIPNSLFGDGSFYLLRFGGSDAEILIDVPVSLTPVDVEDIILNQSNPSEKISFVVGNLEITGDLNVTGNIKVSEKIEADSISSMQNNISQPITFFNSLEVVGSLRVSGDIRATGTVEEEEL